MSGIDFLFERKETQKYTKAMWHENQLIHLYNNNISDGDWEEGKMKNFFRRN